jgi:hypothetical protein
LLQGLACITHVKSTFVVHDWENFLGRLFCPSDGRYVGHRHSRAHSRWEDNVDADVDVFRVVVPLLDNCRGNPKHNSQENHARALGISEENTCEVRVFNSHLAWLDEVPFELSYDLFHVLFAKWDNSLVVQDHVCQQSVRLVVWIDLLYRVITLATLCAPLEAHHCYDSNNDNRRGNYN